MEQFHGSSRTKRGGAGGRKKHFKGVKRSEIGGPFTASKVSENGVRKVVTGRGNTEKVKLKAAAFVNVVTEKGMKKTLIRTVLETPDNKHYARQNIVTKGTLVDTEIGRVRVTNRVGQDGVVNGVLVKEEAK